MPTRAIRHNRKHLHHGPLPRQQEWTPYALFRSVTAWDEHCAYNLDAPHWLPLGAAVWDDEDEQAIGQMAPR